MKANRMMFGQIEPSTASDDPSLVAILLGAFTVMAGVVGYLYKLMETRNAEQITYLKERVKELERKLEECKDEHQKSTERWEALRQEIDIIRKDRYK